MLSSRASRIRALVREMFVEWSWGDVTTHAASLAYYTVFSIAPTLIIAVGVAGALFGEQAARGEIREQLEDLVGTAGAQVIEDMMANAGHRGAGLIASLVGIAVMLFGATGVFAELRHALNHIWRVAPPKSGGLIALVRTRFLSFAMVLGIGFLLLVSLVVSAAISALGDWVQVRLPVLDPAWHLVDFGVSFSVVTALFAMIYKILPDVKIAWRDVWLGAAVTAALFNVGKLAIGFYLGKSGIVSSYGAAGSFAVVLLWVYYSSMVLFLGAEFTHVYARYRSPRPPELKPGATPAGAQPA